MTRVGCALLFTQNEKLKPVASPSGRSLRVGGGRDFDEKDLPSLADGVSGEMALDEIM
jgi:hypothetical protein